MKEIWALIDQGETAEVLAALERASNGGDGDATYMLATFLARGVFTATDWPRALALLTLTAEQGCVAAQIERRLLGPTDDTDHLFAAPAAQRLCESPRVRRIDGFLTPETCDWLIERARGQLKPAATLEKDASDQRKRTISDHRTNSAFVVPVVDGGVVMGVIVERIARALKLPSEVFEGVQVFHYDTGQQYQTHVDYIEGAENQRIATFLVYLNDDFEAGETWFPMPDLKVKPEKGGAVYFANVDPEGRPDPRSIHAGTPPTRGAKWLLSQWVRQQPYQSD